MSRIGVIMNKELKILLLKWGVFFIYSMLLAFDINPADFAKIFYLKLFLREGSLNELLMTLLNSVYVVVYFLYGIYLLYSTHKKTATDYINKANQIISNYCLAAVSLYVLFHIINYQNTQLSIVTTAPDQFLIKPFMCLIFLGLTIFAFFPNFNSAKTTIIKTIALSVFMLVVMLTGIMNATVSFSNEYEKRMAISEGAASYNKQNINFLFYPTQIEKINILNSDILDAILYLQNKAVSEHDVFVLLETYYAQYEHKSDFLKNNLTSLYKNSRIEYNDKLYKKYKENDLKLIEYYKNNGLEKTIEKIKNDKVDSLIPIILEEKSKAAN